MTEERRIVVGIAYPALRKDGHGEWMTPDTVEAMAHEFMVSGRQIGFFHADGTIGHADVVESHIHRGQPETLTAPGGATVQLNPGDWILAARFDPESWALVKAGKVDGWSIDGSGRRRAGALPAAA